MMSSCLFDSDNMCVRFVVLLYDLPSGNHSVESESYDFTLEVRHIFNRKGSVPKTIYIFFSNEVHFLKVSFVSRLHCDKGT